MQDTDPEPITFDDLAHFSKKNGVLYWKNEAVVTVNEHELRLSKWQGFLAVVVALASVVGGIGGGLQGWAAYQSWACDVGWRAIACKPPVDQSQTQSMQRASEIN